MELFKLFYEDQMFELNQKGDSSEAMLSILKLIHVVNTDPKERRKCKTFEEELDT
jgi:hypothetical protein